MVGDVVRWTRLRSISGGIDEENWGSFGRRGGNTYALDRVDVAKGRGPEMVENRLLAGFNHDNQSGRDAQYVTILESLRNGFRGGSSELAKTRGSGGGEVRIYSGAAPELIDFFKLSFI